MRPFALAVQSFLSLAVPYFRGPQALSARLLLAGVVMAEVALVYVAVQVNHWNGRFFNALESRNWQAFTTELMVFAVIALGAVAAGMAQYWLGQRLQIGWRQFLTDRYVGTWMAQGRHYRLRFVAPNLDNAHLRIAEDVQLFVNRTHELGTGFIGSMLALLSFIVILWGLSGTTPLPLGGVDLAFAGWLIVVAIVYAAIGTAITHFIGRPLVALNFSQQRREQDFRFAINRVADNAEPVALMAGETAERRHLGRLFDAIIANWQALVSRQTRLIGFTYGYSQVSIVFPTLVVAPAYLAGAIPLGVLMQTATAFQRVEGAFAYFIAMYAKLAEWRAIVDRLVQFEQALADLDRTAPGIAVAGHADDGHIRVDDLVVRLPTGAGLAAVPEMAVGPGSRTLITGPSGSGKSSLLRALAGLWPVGEGRITFPAGRSVLVLPQRPYFPQGSLAEALCYPQSPEAFGRAAVEAALAGVGLAALVARLDETRAWGDVLSGGEQQKIGFARALLHRPDILLLDEATAALDETTARRLYADLAEALPQTTLVSIGRRLPGCGVHERSVEMRADGDGLHLMTPLPQAAPGTAAAPALPPRETAPV